MNQGQQAKPLPSGGFKFILKSDQGLGHGRQTPFQVNQPVLITMSADNRFFYTCAAIGADGHLQIKFIAANLAGYHAPITTLLPAYLDDFRHLLQMSL